jgi:hypothetical protein
VNLTLGLPPAYNILQAPASVATNPNNIPTTNYAGLLAIIAQENTSPNALTQAIVVANAVSTHSVIDYPALAPLVSVVAANSASLLGLAAPAAVTTNAELTSRAASNLNSVLNSILTGATGATGASN